MESLELGRRIKRNCDNIVSKKRAALLVITIIVTFFYIIPYFLRLYRSPVPEKSLIETCLQDRLTSFVSDSKDFNIHIGYVPPVNPGTNFLPYVGNGHIGIDVVNKDHIFIQRRRNLGLPASVYPLFVLNNIGSYQTAYATNYLTGIVHVFQCYESGFYASFQYYTHRRKQTILVQDIKLSNPTDRNVDIAFQLRQQPSFQGMTTRTVDIQDVEMLGKYNVSSGYIIDSEQNQYIPISVVQRSSHLTMKVDARSSKQVVYYTGISYGSQQITPSIDKALKSGLEQTAIDEITKAASDHAKSKDLHARSWRKLWTTGFTIETSKAQDVLNGDKINATIYYVLSQVKDMGDVSEVMTRLYYAEGCYGNHHTLEATNLWGSLDSVVEINQIVSYWLLTLEKNGCHNMLRAGARGVAEAMVLSFGGLR